MTEVLDATIIEPNVALSVTVHPGELIDNFDALEAEIRFKVEPFKGAVVSRECLKDSKKVLADLRATSGDLNKRRKDTKTLYMVPFDVFEARIKAIDALITTEISNIDVQLKKINEDIHKERYQKLVEAYETYAPLLVPVVPADKVIEDGWFTEDYWKAQKRKGETKAESALYDKVGHISKDWDTLRSLKLHEQAEVIFFDTLDLGQAIAENARLVEKADAIKALKVDMGLSQPDTATQGDNRTCVPIETEPTPQTGLESFVLEFTCPLEIAQNAARVIRDAGYKVTKFRSVE